jgi:hypothetical protein
MSCDCTGPDFWCEVLRTARKCHICYECNSKILPGEQYLHVSGKWDGEIKSIAEKCWNMIHIQVLV